MSVYVEMEYYDQRHARDLKYHGFISHLHEFAFLLDRRGINAADIASLKIDGHEREDIAAIAEKAGDLLNGSQKKEPGETL